MRLAGDQALNKPNPGRTTVGVLEVSHGRPKPGRAQVLNAMEGPGAVLVRGLEMDTRAFERFTREFCNRFHRVAARDRFREQHSDGFTARAPERNFSLLVHSEGTYQPFESPGFAFFYCLVAPVFPGGEVILVDGRLFLDQLPEELRNRFEKQGVIFEAYWEPERWQAEFGIEKQAQFDSVQRAHPGLECTFEGENMRYRCRRPVIQPDRHGELVFANAILAHLHSVKHARYQAGPTYAKESNRVCFGDGKPISDDVINTLIDIQDSVAYNHELRDQDLLVIDNTRVMHGRRHMQQDCQRVMLTRFGFLEKEAAQRSTGSAQQAL